ncbi:hypothetical protein [Martelella alba]|uniref:hypothetical protein n=1 Tax=Martelella alba TaxID=2590451 RepID=UPI0015E874FA|nr:hypothetical protein [Martelella alba]
MKRSVAISFILHCLVIGMAVLALGSPDAFEVADVNALPVELIPVQEITQIQQGDDKADLADIAAPVPTKRPDPVEDAQNVGDNTVDLSTQKNAQAATHEQKAAAPPKPSEAPAPEPQPTPEPEPAPAPAPTPEPAPAPKPAPAPAPKPAPEPQPEPKPEPAPQAVETPDPAPAPAEQTPDDLVFPDQAPLPQKRPDTQVAEAKPKTEPPKTEPVKTPDQAEKPTPKPTEKPKAEKSETATDNTENFDVDQIAALLNRDAAQGGGAKRSETPAALGGQKTTTGAQLTQSELDALRGQIQRNWSILAGLDGADGVRIRIQMSLDQNGAIIGEPQVTATGGSDTARQILASGARRAVMKASPFTQLPPEKYEAWKEVVVNFDPSQML